MSRPGVWAGALAVLVQTGSGQWCPLDATSTRTQPTTGPPASTCTNSANQPKLGFVCPENAGVCRAPPNGASYGAQVTQTATGTTITQASDCAAPNVWYPPEFASWGDAIAATWAGQEAVACSGSTTVGKRCDGVNDCPLTPADPTPSNGCRVTTNGNTRSVVCSSDEQNCGGLVDTLVAGGLPGLSVPGWPTSTTVVETVYPEPAQGNSFYNMTLSNELEILMGPGLASNWIQPYGWTLPRTNGGAIANMPGTTDTSYSMGGCVDYAEIPTKEPSLVVTPAATQTTGFTYSQTAADQEAANLLAQQYGVTVPTCTTCNGISCTGCTGGSISYDTELGLTATYTPPDNFIGTIQFTYSLTNGPLSNLESTSVSGSISMHVGLSPCITDATYCGEHGTCQGPSGCECTTPHYSGERCNVKSEPLLNAEYSWGGWTTLIIVLILGGLVAGFIVWANKKQLFIYKEDFDEMQMETVTGSRPFVPAIPERQSSATPMRGSRPPPPLGA